MNYHTFCSGAAHVLLMLLIVTIANALRFSCSYSYSSHVMFTSVYARDALSHGGEDLWMDMPPWAVEGCHCGAMMVDVVLMMRLLMIARHLCR